MAGKGQNKIISLVRPNRTQRGKTNSKKTTNKVQKHRSERRTAARRVTHAMTIKSKFQTIKQEVTHSN